MSEQIEYSTDGNKLDKVNLTGDDAKIFSVLMDMINTAKDSDNEIVSYSLGMIVKNKKTQKPTAYVGGDFNSDQLKVIHDVQNDYLEKITLKGGD